MKLLTQENKNDLPKLYATEKAEDPNAIVKFFTPDWHLTWYATEFDGKDTFFGKVFSSMCPEGELGYFSLSQLKSIKGPLHLLVERDNHFGPTPLSRCNPSL